MAGSPSQRVNGAPTVVPNAVKSFVTYFQRYFKSNNAYELRNYYKSGFRKISDTYFSDCLWPEARVIAPLVENDTKFLCLYKELYYRHMYAKLGDPTLEQRFESFVAYQELFKMLASDAADGLEMPQEWLHDMVMEYVYQFQSFCQWRGKLTTKDPAELQMLRTNREMWSTALVIKSLSDVVNATGAHEILAAKAKTETAKTKIAHSRFMLGLFAVVALARLHVLIADYGTAVELLSLVKDYGARTGTISKVRSAYVNVHYYMGFSNMMLRKYSAAIAAFVPAVLKIRRAQVNAGNSKAFSKDTFSKKYEQMVALLAVSVILCPGPQKRFNNDVREVLESKCGTQMDIMRQGDENALRQFESIFAYASPKFVAPCPPDFTDLSRNVDEDARNSQTRKFMRELAQSQKMPQIRSFLRLYRSISLEKLAGLQRTRALSPEDTMKQAEVLRQQLLCLKHRASSTGESAGAGAGLGAFGGVHFWLDGDTVHVDEQPRQRHFGGWFMNHLEKFDSILHQK